MKLCELCDQEASLHCASDSAFLCFDCDSKVHAANFLVARHLREPLCSLCKALSGDFVSGPGAELLSRRRRAFCRSCSPESDSDLDDDSASSFSSSACISSTDQSSSTVHTRKVSDCDRDRDFGGKLRKIGSVSSSLTDLDSNFPPQRLGGRLSGEVPVEFSVGCGGDSVAAKRRGAKWRAVPDATAEGIFVNWCRKFGVDGNAVVSPASHALVFCLEKLTVLPFRVALAASFWFGLRLCGDSTVPTWQQLRRLEEISGVPAKQILAVHAKLTRALRISREPHDLKEGWAESSA